MPLQHCPLQHCVTTPDTPKRHLRELPSIRAVVILLWLATSVETAGLTPIHLGAPRAFDGVRPFLDSYGRERLFHGTNAVVKGPPWVPMTAMYDEDLSMVAKDFEALMAQGVNAIRLGVMWSGVEPSQGKYNESYLDEVDKIVQTAAAHGVYTLLDMHQDGTPRSMVFPEVDRALGVVRHAEHDGRVLPGLSEYFCGEGVPTWAVRQTLDFHNRSQYNRAFPAPYDTLNDVTDFFDEPALPGTPRLPTRQACATKKKGPGWYGIASLGGLQPYGLPENYGPSAHEPLKF